MRQLRLRFDTDLIDGGAAGILLLPERGTGSLLTLLHGAGEGPESVIGNSSLADRAEELGLAVLLPALGNSFCLDWGAGQMARSALLEVLLPAMRRDFGLAGRRQDNIIGGISMGGYGALRLGLEPDGPFAAAFSLSGALDLERAAQFCRICSLATPGDLREAAARPGSELTERLEDWGRRPDSAPPLYLAWGERDWFRTANRCFAQRARALALPVLAEESPGLHNWAYWREALLPALDWAARCTK